MKFVTAMRGYGVLTLALLLFSGAFFFSFEKVLKEQVQATDTAEENYVWATSQTEIELFRLLDALREYSIAESPVNRDELQRRYEILVSQIQRLRQGTNAVKLHGIEGAERTVNDVSTQLREIERTVAVLNKGDRPGALALGDGLRRFAAPLHEMTVGALHDADQVGEGERQRLKDVHVQRLFYFAGVALAGTVLLLLLFRGIGRANRLLHDREATEERLRDSEQRFRDYAASSSDWLWETDSKGRFTYFSRGYLEKVGLNAVEILGKTHEDIALAGKDQAAWEKQRELLAQQQPFRDFKYSMSTEGGVRHIKVSGVPVFDAGATFQGYRGTGTDLTAQVEAETDAMRARVLLAEAVESLDEGFAVFDPQDRLVQYNTQFRGIYADAADVLVPGASFEEITRAAAYRGAFPDALGREEAWIAECLARHRNPETPYDFRLKDGRWMQARENILANGWRVGTRIDVTYQKRREEGLRREALIWEQMSDGVIVTDLMGHITNWNPAAERMFGYPAAEVIGRTPRLLHGPDNPDLLAKILEAVHGEGGWSGEIDFQRKNGSAGIADTVVVPLRDDGGNRIAIIWVNYDITLRKQTEVELLSAKEQAELANLAKSQFLATMSHEIRTPMNGVLGMIGLLLDTNLDEQQRGYAVTVRESGEALVNIIDDILDFSKMEAGKLELDRADFDLRQVTEGVVDLLASHAQDKGVEIGCFIAPDVATAVRGDSGRLRQILLNLAGNAVKFTEQGGVSVLVSSVESTSARTLVKVEIVDTGIGIPDHLHAGLFAEFTQVDPSYTRRYGGTGLGLAISMKLTQLMGGDIGFTSKLGAGSTFWFTVELERRAPTAAEAAALPRLGAARVLVADDNPTVSGLFERQLSAQGLSVTTVSSAAAALSTLVGAARLRQAFKFALIDQELGGRRGDELARQIKREPLVAATQLVLVMRLGGRADSAAARRAGFEATLSKPVRQSALVNCLARLSGLVVEPQGAAAPEVTPASPAARRAVPATLAPAAEAAAAADLSGLRVLLVEDSQVNRMVATAMLAKSVGAIDTANNGIEAIDAVRAKPYDLVLMDVAMPEMDGFEATRIIRSMSGSKGRLPIIAMTAHAMEGDRERCLEAGMDDYVTKPIDRARLMKAMAHWRDKARAHPDAVQAAETIASPRRHAPARRPAAIQGLPLRSNVQPPAAVRPDQMASPRTPATGAIAYLREAKDVARHAPVTTPAAPPVTPAVASPVAGARQLPGSNGGQAAAMHDAQADAARAPEAVPAASMRDAQTGVAVLDSATLEQLEADTDPTVVQALVKTFILETIDRLDRISRAANTRDLATLEREAHSLKSSSGTFGAQALQERAKAIEFACRDGKADAALALAANIRELAASAAHAMVQHFQPGA